MVLKLAFFAALRFDPCQSTPEIKCTGMIGPGRTCGNRHIPLTPVDIKDRRYWPRIDFSQGSDRSVWPVITMPDIVVLVWKGADSVRLSWVKTDPNQGLL
jgi:hypothetical protein